MAFSRQIVSVIAASVLAAHVVVGCCAHHAHLRAYAADLEIVAQQADHDHASQHACHHHSADPSAPSHDRGPCDHPCGKGTCSFLASSRIIVPDLAQPAGIAATSFASLLDLSALWSITTDPFSERAIAPPVRSHLSKCVLLV